MSQQEIHFEDAARPPLPQDADAEARKEREGLKWCERMGAKLNAKKSGYRPNHRGGGNARCNR